MAMVDPELDALKREFLAEARAKVREMESKLDGEEGPDSLERLAYLAHQLKGSGGSYGFERISDEAAQLEKAAERMTSGAGGVKQKLRQHVANLLAEIDKHLRELAASP